jgi:hypothetical protein
MNNEILVEKLKELLKKKRKSVEIWFVNKSENHKKRLLHNCKCKRWVTSCILELQIQRDFKFDF